MPCCYRTVAQRADRVVRQSAHDARGYDRAQVFVYGFFSSLHTSRFTLAYADVADAETSSASTIASTMQQCR